jgi:pimeloyl-ACP methyl ester carboxylesterase
MERMNAGIDGHLFVERHVEVAGQVIRYAEGGSGDPIVHFHSAGGPEISEAHRLLAHRHRVIMLELPGFSDQGSHEPDTIEQLAEIVVEALDELQLNKFAVMGMSFGAKPALLVALMSANRVSAVILESPAAVLLEGGGPPKVSPAEFARLFFAHPELIPPRPIRAPKVEERMVATAIRLLGNGRDLTFEQRLQELTAPVLVICGKNDGIVPPDTGWFYQQLVPAFEYKLLDECGHAPSIERADEFVRLIESFLERVRSGQPAETSV